MKMEKKSGVGVRLGRSGRGGGQGGCERRIEVIVKIPQKVGGQGGCEGNEEYKLL